MAKKVEKKEVKPKAEKPKLAYHLEVRVNDVEFKTDAKDLETALTEFVESPVFPLGAKTTLILKYSKGKNERQRLWHTPLARRQLRILGLRGSAIAVLATKLTADLA